MTWQQNVPIRPWVVDEPGYCLRYTQAFFGAPEMHPSAWVAWQNQKYRHGASEPLPPVPCVLWFSHYGTYGEPEVYGNWGHVTAYVPGDAIYSSPTHGGASFMRYANIQQVEAAYNCSYVGWSEDLNGLRICENIEDTPTPIPPTIEEDTMTTPIIAMKLDNGPMHSLGVLIEPDGAVIALTPDQWAFWQKTAKLEPIECTNPGHWEYLMQVMADRRKRYSVIATDADLEAMSKAVNASVADLRKALKV